MIQNKIKRRLRIKELKHEQYIQNKIVSTDDECE